MKQFFTLGLIICLFFGLSAQITITNSTFPAKGDVLKMAIAEEANINMGTTNGPQRWDFSSLNSGFLIEENYLDVSEGSAPTAFPAADMLVKIEGNERYIKSSARQLEIVGVGGDNGFIPFEVNVNYTKFPILRRAPLKFIDSNSGASAFNIAFSSTIIPAEILDALPIKPDSIRIKFESSARSTVDGFGTLKIQNNDFSVLREKTETISSTNVDLKLGFVGWIPLGAEILQNLPGGFAGLVGNDTTFTYNFYSDSRKEILVSADYNVADELESVTFVNLGGVSSSTDNPPLVALETKVYPNPVTDQLQISIPNINDGSYLVTLTDISGKVVYAQPLLAQNGLFHDINTHSFNIGQYILDVRSQHNSVHFSSKVVVSR